MGNTKTNQSLNGLKTAGEKLSRSGRWRMFFCLLMGIGGIAISLMLFQILRKHQQQLAEVQFQHDARRHIEEIEKAAIDRLSVVDIIEAFYSGSELVERSEFHTFSEPLFARYQGVQILGWAPLIEESDQSAHEKAIREGGFPDYKITERDNQKRYVPAKKKALYCPILFIEPFEKYRSLLGYDLRSDPACRSAMNRAIKTGRPAAAVCSPSEKDPIQDRLFYVVTPIRSAITSVDHPQIIGFVFGIFDIDAIVNEALRSCECAGIDILIREHLQSGKGDTIYRKVLSPHAEDDIDQRKSSSGAEPVVQLIDTVDRQGEIECVPTEYYFSNYRTWEPILVLAAGLIITVLLVWQLYLMTGRTARVRRLAAQRTVDLRASEQRFRRLFENAADAIFLHDFEGKIIDVNKHACDSLGYSREEILQMTVADIDTELVTENQSRFWDLPDSEYPVAFEGAHLRKNGTSFPVEIRLVPVSVGGRRLMIGMARDITERKLAEEKLRRDQRLLREMLDLQEKDRKLISYEIHDGLAQQLTGALMKFQSVEHMIDRNPDGARIMLHESIQLLSDAAAETRRLIGGLRPPVLDESGVAAAVEVFISGQRENDLPEIEFINNLGRQRFAPPLETAVFRVVQESLTNALRYSHSEKIRVELNLTDERVLIDVQDWGVGFDPNDIGGGHYGLRGICERARLMGGSASIESSPEQGTHIHVGLPFAAAGK